MTDKELNKLFGHFLTCSYAYYKMDISLVTDEQYDKMCVVLGRNYGRLTHKYKFIVTPEDFDAGTGFAIRYPAPMEWAIRQFVQQQKEKV
jgi:NAD-dependent DNA ligase